MLAAFASAVALPARAQDFAPGRPVTLVVPSAPGGTTAFAARLLAEPLSQQLGVPVLVDNRAGANGVPDAQVVARAGPDGQTLPVQSSGFHVGSQAVVRKLGWNPRTDVAPTGLLMDVPQGLLLHPSVPATTLAELVAYARADPGKLNHASSGNGSVQHLGTEQLKRLTGIQLQHAPYRGAGPAMQDPLAGRVEICPTTPPALPFIQNGQLRAVSLSARERHPALPNVPTAAEAGRPGLSAEAWSGLFAPASMPEPLIARLAVAVDALIAAPACRGRADRCPRPARSRPCRRQGAR
jgi:tripartite-type tricarboxylate transporter receptor subunit TctC